MTWEDYKPKAAVPHPGTCATGCCVLYFVAVDGNHLIYTRTLNEFSIVLANSWEDEEGKTTATQRTPLLTRPPPTFATHKDMAT